MCHIVTGGRAGRSGVACPVAGVGGWLGLESVGNLSVGNCLSCAIAVCLRWTEDEAFGECIVTDITGGSVGRTLLGPKMDRAGRFSSSSTFINMLRRGLQVDLRWSAN